MHRWLGLLLSSLFILQPLMAKTPVWKVSRGNDFLFIGGTIHLLGKDDYPLPATFDMFYNISQKLVLETDMEKLKSPTTQMKIMQLMSYQDGSKLQDHLKPATWKILEQHVTSQGLPMQSIQLFKPGMVSMMLSVLELKKLGINSIGVDQHFADKAREENKSQGQLETVDEQLDFIASLGSNDPDEFILYTLRDLKKLPRVFTEMRTAWKTGDMDLMNKIGIEPMRNNFPDTYQTLIIERNKDWVPQIESLLSTHEVEMILVGALHLAGKDSILKMLEAKGYAIKQY